MESSFEKTRKKEKQAMVALMRLLQKPNELSTNKDVENEFKDYW